jgi:hypothetical protein
MSLEDVAPLDEPLVAGAVVGAVVVAGRFAPSGKQIVCPIFNGDWSVLPFTDASGPAFTPARFAMPNHESPR